MNTEERRIIHNKPVKRSRHRSVGRGVSVSWLTVCTVITGANYLGAKPLPFIPGSTKMSSPPKKQAKVEEKDGAAKAKPADLATGGRSSGKLVGFANFVRTNPMSDRYIRMVIYILTCLIREKDLIVVSGEGPYREKDLIDSGEGSYR
eukprot:gene8065-2810_t